jgi:hypothetical protein
MINESICKFNFTQSGDLVCHHFIYECTDIQATPLVAEHYTLGLLTMGEGELCVNGIVNPLQIGDFFVIQKGERFSISGKTPPEYTYICFSGRRSVEYMDRLGISAANRVFRGYTALISFWRDTLQKTTEQNIDYKKLFLTSEFKIHNTLDAISHATCGMSIDIEAKAMAICSISGMTARMISRFRSPVDILGITTNEKSWRKLALSWGVTPAMCEEFTSTDVLFYTAKKIASATLNLEHGDKIIITGGDTSGRSGKTNLIKIEDM